MPARRIIGVPALAEANSPRNRFAVKSAVSRWKRRDLLTSARLTARAMTAAPHEWLTKAAPTKAQASRMPLGTPSKKSELSHWSRRRLEGATGKHSTVKDGANSPELETNSRRPPVDVATEAASQRCRSKTPALGIAPGKIARLTAWEDFENWIIL